MRSDINGIFGWLHTLHHPSDAVLLASLDGELESLPEARTKAHLEVCAICRMRRDRLQDGLRIFEESSLSMPAEFSIETGLQNLATAIEQRAHSPEFCPQPQQLAEDSPLRGRLQSELSIYLGDRAATQLLERCNQSLSQRDRLRESIAPVIIGFLGQHTGSAVLANLSRIWDQSQGIAG